MDGRLEMIILHVALVLDRLAAEGEAGHELARALNEAYVADVDDALRQIGIGDMGVPRRVKQAAAALYERQLAYRKAIEQGELKLLAEALATFALGATLAGATSGVHAAREESARLAAYAIEVARQLAVQPGAALLSGRIDFPAPTR